MNQNVVGTEQSRQQQLNEMLYGNGKERWAIDSLGLKLCKRRFDFSRSWRSVARAKKSILREISIAPLANKSSRLVQAVGTHSSHSAD